MTTVPTASQVTPSGVAQSEPGAGQAVVRQESGPLSHIPLFSALRDSEQQELMRSMQVENVGPNQTIFWRGDRGDSFYLINRGQVSVTVPNEDGEHVVLDYLGPGGFFGEISLLDAGPRTATVRATQPTELYVLRREDFHCFLRQHPQVSIEILTVMGQRQRVSTDALRGVKNPNVVFEQSRTTTWQQTSDTIAGIAASQWFILSHVTWFALWVGINFGAKVGIVPESWAFDPFPFGLLTMVVSLEAILLSIFILVSQNRQVEKDRVRIDLDYQVNVKAHTEIMMLRRKLEEIEDRLAGTTSPRA